MIENSPYSLRMPPHLVGFNLVRLQQSRIYDVLMRLPLLVFACAFVIKAATDLLRFERDVDPMLPDTVYALNIAAQLAVIAFIITLAAMVVARARPAGKARGLEPRVSALFGTFLITTVVLFPRHELSFAAGVASTLLLLAGNALAVYVLTHLGRSFSIMPEARGLVTSGLYRYVRHPLYLAEMIAAIGTVIQYVSTWTALILAVQIAFQLRRMRNEEIVLMEIFPDHAAYKEKTARIIPGIY
jgi:protein-S-isoprenylcysteine O-methyltransferase Ste14